MPKIALTRERLLYLSQFGKAYLETLKQNRPKLYQQLRAAGELNVHLAAIDRRASATFQEIVAQLSKNLPADDEERAQALMGISSQARELVMSEILVREEETERAEERGFYL